MKHRMIDNALDYAVRGWRVLPLNTIVNGKCSCKKASCGSPGKHPAIKDWTTLATTDPNQVRNWWTKWPHANIGIATGPGSNLFVVDVDGDSGLATLNSWLDKPDLKFETLTALTGKGRHLYFSYPADITVRNSVKSIADGVDVRGDDGFVVAPPSVHISGAVYRWESSEQDVQPAPSWLLDLITGGRDQAAADDDDDEELIPKGSRNNALFRKGSSLRGYGFEVEEIREKLTELNEARCEAPLDASEVNAIAQSVGRYDKGTRSKSTAVEANPLYFMLFDVNLLWLANRDVTMMSDAQKGRYMTLLCEAWKSCGELPGDKEMLFRLCRPTCNYKRFCDELPQILQPFEVSQDGTILHRVLKELWQKKFKDYKQKRAAGKKSAASKAQKKKLAAQGIPVEGQ